MHERRSRWTGVNWIAKKVEALAPVHHLRRRTAVHVGLIEDCVGSHVCWPGGQHLLLAVDQIGSIERSQLESVAVCDGVGRAGLDTVSAENAAVVVDVVHLGIALGATDAILGGILGGFNIDAVRRTGRRAEKARDTFLQPSLVALQHVRATKASFDTRAAQRTFAVGIVLYRRGLEHLHEGDAHAFSDGGDVFQDGHCSISIPKSVQNRPCSASNGVNQGSSCARRTAEGGCPHIQVRGFPRQRYFATGGAGGCSGAGTALSSHAVYQRSSSICDPAARRWVVKSNATGEPLPVKPPAFSNE